MSAGLLAVAKPALSFDDAGGGVAVFEKPVNILAGPALDRGTAVGPESLAASGYFVYRRARSGASLEIWDDGAKAWQPDPGADVSGAKPAALAYRAGQPAPWQGILVAAGGKDGAGQPAFASARGGYPIYSVRTFFAPPDGPGTLSTPSDDITFASASDRNLMVIAPGPDEEPPGATQLRVILKDTALQPIAQLIMERAAPGARITVSNAAGASVVLHPDGHIELVPAGGRPVVIGGDVETEHLTYRPAGGGLKRVLP